MISREAMEAARNAYDIERDCIEEMKDYFDEEQFSKAVELLAKAPRIGTTGCGHSGIICQHIAHLMCCIERPARFVSPAEAVHGATGFLQPGDVMIFASRGGKTKELLPIIDICKAKGVAIIAITDVFRAKIVDVSPETMMIEITGNNTKIDAFIGLLDGFEIQEMVRTGLTGLARR